MCISLRSRNSAGKGFHSICKLKERINVKARQLCVGSHFFIDFVHFLAKNLVLLLWIENAILLFAPFFRFSCNQTIDSI